LAAAQERKNVMIDRLREQTAKKKAENVRLGWKSRRSVIPDRYTDFLNHRLLKGKGPWLFLGI
jgi:hypothetical protein